jgi:uncharacterized protein YjbI with pentapeptide repeats
VALSLAIAMLIAATVPPPLPPPAPVQTCEEAGLVTDIRDSPWRVDGNLIDGASGLIALREVSGDSLLLVDGGNFEAADLRNARLHNICFFGSDFTGSDWSGAKAAGIGFIFAKLDGAKLVNVRMKNIRLYSADLDGTDASGADFDGGRLEGNWSGSVSGLRLDRANLSGFLINCGITEGDRCGKRGDVSLRGTRLARARIGIFLRGSDWTGAVIDRTEVGAEQLLELGAAIFKGPILVRGGDAWSGDAWNGDPAIAALSPAEYARLRPHLLKDHHPGDGNELKAAARRARPGWLKPGAKALFVRPRIAFDDVARAGPLYARLLPVLIRGAHGHVTVEVNADGSIDARGGAVGGNGHLCDVGGDRLRLDPATGWYSGPHEPFEGSPPNGTIPAFPADPPEWRDRPMPVLRFSGDRVEVYEPRLWGPGFDDPRMSHYVMCGARAGFDEMLLVPSDNAEARRIWGYRDSVD